jgi:hypothetical protein
LLAGELVGRAPRPGKVRLVRTGRRAEVLAERTLLPEHFQGERQRFALACNLGANWGGFWITFECPDGQALELARLELWQLTQEFAPAALCSDPWEVARRLREGRRQPYPVVASFPDDVHIHENPEARELATLVREVRPALSDVDAARQTLRPGPAVRELSHVVAPDGRSHNLSIPGPRRFAGGTAALRSYRADDITVSTATEGEGFLVLAVTRCAGWSATVDGVPVPIHAVDGPLMGVRVPAGQHTVRFRFRPVLVWAGMAAAALALGGVWGAVLIVAVRRRRRALLFSPQREDGSRNVTTSHGGRRRTEGGSSDARVARGGAA